MVMEFTNNTQAAKGRSAYVMSQLVCAPKEDVAS